MLNKKRSGSPLYVTIAMSVLQNVARGSFREGDTLPSSAELASKFSCGKMTANQAYRRLSDLGVVDCPDGVPPRLRSAQKARELLTEHATAQFMEAVRTAIASGFDRTALLAHVDEALVG